MNFCNFYQRVSHSGSMAVYRTTDVDRLCLPWVIDQTRNIFSAILCPDFSARKQNRFPVSSTGWSGICSFSSCIAYVFSIHVAGIILSILLLVLFIFLRQRKKSGAVFNTPYGMFHLLVYVPWPNALTRDTFPAVINWIPNDVVSKLCIGRDPQ